MRNEFKFRKEYSKIYRVSPDGPYLTIQAAINQALADGRNLASPATVEIYFKDGGYTEDLTIYTGISLVGVPINDVPQFGRVCPAVNGTVTWTPVAGNRNTNQVYIESLNIKGKNGADTFTYAGTVGSQVNLVNAQIIKDQEDGFIAFRKTNTQGSGGGSARAQVNLYDSVIYMFESVNVGLTAIEMLNGGQFRLRGTESYIESEGGAAGSSVIDLYGNANLSVIDGIVDGEAEILIKISSASVFVLLQKAKLEPYGGPNQSIFDFVAAGNVSAQYSIFSANNPSHQLAVGAANGSLGLSFCTFSADFSSPSSYGGAFGVSSYPTTLNVEYRGEGVRVARNGYQVTAYVGYVEGFPSIQSAWDFLNNSGQSNAIIMLQSNTDFTEDLNLSYLPGTFGLRIVGANPSPVVQEFGPSTNTEVPRIIGNTVVDPSGDRVYFQNVVLSEVPGSLLPTLKQTGVAGGVLHLLNCQISNNSNTAASVIEQDYSVTPQSLVIQGCDLVYESDDGIGLKFSPAVQGNYISVRDSNYYCHPIDVDVIQNLVAISSESNLTFIKCDFRGRMNTFLECLDAVSSYDFNNCYVNCFITNGSGFLYTAAANVLFRNCSGDFGGTPGTLLARDGVAAKAEILQVSNAYLNNDGYNIRGGYNGAILKSGIDFAIGATAADTANNIAAAINASVDPLLQNIVYAWAYGDDVLIYPWNWTTAANSYEIFPFGHSFITTGIGSFYKVVGAGLAWGTKDINGNDDYFWYRCADATVQINNTGAFFDVVGAGLAWTAQDGLGADHYFWYEVTDGANFPQTDPGLAGTGHVISILTADTAAQIATKTNTVVDGLAEFESSVATDTVTVENGGLAVAAAVTSGATVSNNNQTDPALTGTGHLIDLYSSDTASNVASKTNTVINTLVGVYTSTVITDTVNLVNGGEAISVDVNAATITNSNPPATITPWGGGANGPGGQFYYGSSNFNNNKIQNTIFSGQYDETVVGF